MAIQQSYTTPIGVYQGRPQITYPETPGFKPDT